MSESCEHVFENTGLVFCTIPEAAVQVCMKCGEQRVRQEDVEGQGQKTELKCDICGCEMTMRKNESLVYFLCGSPSCEQKWNFLENESSCTILKHLWPSGMKDDSKMFRDEYLPAWLKEKEFHAEARFIASFWSRTQRDEYLQECHNTLAEWHKAHPPKRHPWWRVWERR